MRRAERGGAPSRFTPRIASAPSQLLAKKKKHKKKQRRMGASETGRRGEITASWQDCPRRCSAAQAEQHGWTPGEHACSHGGGAPIAALRLRSLLSISAAETTTISRERARLTGLCSTFAPSEFPARRGQARTTRRLTSFLSGSSL